MPRKLWPLLGLLAIIVVGGCSPYVDDYEYSPRPALAVIPPPTTQQSPPVTAMASVVGVRRADDKAKIPESVEVRVRIENSGAGTVIFDPHTLQLTNGSLVQFPGPVILGNDQTASIPLGAAAYVTAYFPFPPGLSYDTTDLQSLQLRWGVQIDGQGVGQVVYFQRVQPVYYSQYYSYPPYFWYGGVVVVHGGRGRR